MENAKPEKKTGSKGFGFNLLGAAAISLGVFVVILTVMSLVLTNLQAQTTANSSAYNSTVTGMAGLTSLSGWTPTVVAVIGGAIVILIILGVFAYRRQDSGVV